ncbi:MAG: hypothetical protein H7Y42_06080 [Chitinophagaceae bacterium]|nr:hypothetical protein [Chitinophagaceae bacterium]
MLCLVSMSSLAQLSREDSIMAIRGKWKKDQAVVGAHDAALKQQHYPVVYKKIDSIASFFMQAYPVPTGMEAKWYANIANPPLFAKAPTPYSFWSSYKYYYFNKNLQKIMLGDETTTWAYVFVNSFNWLLRDSKHDLPTEGEKKRIWQLPRILPGDWKGHQVFEAFTHAPDARAVVVTKRGRVPWKAVSQRQYLEAVRNTTEETYNKIVKDYDSGIERGRKAIEEIKTKKGIDADMKQRMAGVAQAQLDNSLSRRETMLGNARKLRDKDLSTIDEYILNASPEMLEKQAVLNLNKDFITFKKFEDPTAREAMSAVIIDQSYFDTTRPSYEPQFMVLYWRWNNNAPGQYFRQQLENNFPLEKMQAMIREKAGGVAARPSFESGQDRRLDQGRKKSMGISIYLSRITRRTSWFTGRRRF